MLETIRNNTRSLIIYLIFGILIAVFIYSFGPQAGQRSQGCGSSVRTAAKVNGSELTETSWRFGILAMNQGSASGERARRGQVREKVLDRLFVRELLAHTAEDMGFRISDDEVRQKIVNGDIYILGTHIDGKPGYYIKEEGEETPRFRAKALEGWIRNRLGMESVDRFIDEEKRELLAQKVLDLVNAGVRVSTEEVQHNYALETTKAEIAYVAFSMAAYRDAIEPTAAELDEYLKVHETDLKAQYDKEADRWKGRDKEVRVRDLFVKSERPQTAAEPPKPAEEGAPKPGEPVAPQRPAPAPAKPDPARAKADAALAKIKGGQDFVAVLKAVSPDVARGGDLGWRPLRGLRLGAAVAEAVGKLDKGQTTDVIETPDGYHIVQLIDKREGDLAFDTIKRELAEDALRDERAKAAAKADAEKALANVKGGTPLEKQFSSEGGDAPAAGTKPRLQKGADISRVGGYITGIGTSPEITKAIFDELAVGEVAPKVYDVSGDYFIVKLVKRDEPDMAKFQTEKPRLTAELRDRKAMAAVADFEGRRCREAVQRGSLSFDPSLVTYNDQDKKTPAYVPCMTLR